MLLIFVAEFLSNLVSFLDKGISITFATPCLFIWHGTLKLISFKSYSPFKYVDTGRILFES